MSQIVLIKNFCETLDTKYLVELNDTSKEIFIKHSIEVMQKEKGFKRLLTKFSENNSH